MTHTSHVNAAPQGYVMGIRVDEYSVHAKQMVRLRYVCLCVFMIRVTFFFLWLKCDECEINGRAKVCVRMCVCVLCVCV
jgi:hypothetical protein